MHSTSRELVYQALEFDRPARAPRQLWALPWAAKHHTAAFEEIKRRFPDDIVSAPGYCAETSPFLKGDPYAVGEFTDDWGCVFSNIQEGVIGEVKTPLVEDWGRDLAKVHVPREWLSIDPERVNRFCGETDCFVMGGCCPRPFEQLQFIRGTANLYLDLLTQPSEMKHFLAEMHAFYCALLERWAKTDVDALMFMDDWGSQQNLLIAPELWKDVFKPLYRDYIQIAHGASKKIFMHSDGYTPDIFPCLVELGLDAINAQLFCIGLDRLAPFAGQITFWGEIDRQHILPAGSPEDVRMAVKEVHAKLWKHGGCIAQCEFGPGAQPENVREVFATWDEVTMKGQS